MKLYWKVLNKHVNNVQYSSVHMKKGRQSRGTVPFTFFLSLFGQIFFSHNNGITFTESFFFGFSLRLKRRFFLNQLLRYKHNGHHWKSKNVLPRLNWDEFLA